MMQIATKKKKQYNCAVEVIYYSGFSIWHKLILLLHYIYMITVITSTSQVDFRIYTTHDHNQ